MPPPFCPTTYGKRQTFPIPIAQPALTSKNPKRDLKDSRFTNPSSSFFDQFRHFDSSYCHYGYYHYGHFVYFTMTPRPVSMTQTSSILIFTFPFSACTDAMLPFTSVIIGAK